MNIKKFNNAAVTISRYFIARSDIMEEKVYKRITGSQIAS